MSHVDFLELSFKFEGMQTLLTLYFSFHFQRGRKKKKDDVPVSASNISQDGDSMQSIDSVPPSPFSEVISCYTIKNFLHIIMVYSI